MTTKNNKPDDFEKYQVQSSTVAVIPQRFTNRWGNTAATRRHCNRTNYSPGCHHVGSENVKLRHLPERFGFSFDEEPSRSGAVSIQTDLTLFSAITEGTGVRLFRHGEATVNNRAGGESNRTVESALQTSLHNRTGVSVYNRGETDDCR
jgi:hypothetical protein